MRRQRGFGKREVAEVGGGDTAEVTVELRSTGAQASQNAAHGGRREVRTACVMEPRRSGRPSGQPDAGFAACAPPSHAAAVASSDHRASAALSLTVDSEPRPAGKRRRRA